MRKVINQGPKYAEQETIRFEAALGNSRMCRAAASLPVRATHTDLPPGRIRPGYVFWDTECGDTTSNPTGPHDHLLGLETDATYLAESRRAFTTQCQILYAERHLLQV